VEGGRGRGEREQVVARSGCGSVKQKKGWGKGKSVLGNSENVARGTAGQKKRSGGGVAGAPTVLKKGGGRERVGGGGRI